MAFLPSVVSAAQQAWCQQFAEGTFNSTVCITDEGIEEHHIAGL